MTVKLDRICALIGIEAPRGAAHLSITGVASLEDAREGDISFLSNTRYRKYLTSTAASAVIVPSGMDSPPGIITLPADDPYLAFVQVLELFDTRSRGDVARGIDDRAVVSPDAVLGADVSIGPFAVIGGEVSIGDGTTIGPGTTVLPGTRIGGNCLVYPNVTIMDGCLIGDRVIIHAGAVIGSDGFGFAPHDGRLKKIPQIGRVRLEDDVEIGANTCIDRATFGETVVSRGTKLDNLIQIAHNVKIGMSSVLAAQVGVSGSTEIGGGVRIGGQAGFAGHLNVGEGSSVGAQAGVTKDVPSGETVSGYPAKTHMLAMRLEAALRQVPALLKTVKRQELRIEKLEQIIREQEKKHAG